MFKFHVSPLYLGLSQLIFNVFFLLNYPTYVSLHIIISISQCKVGELLKLLFTIEFPLIFLSLFLIIFLFFFIRSIITATFVIVSLLFLQIRSNFFETLPSVILVSIYGQQMLVFRLDVFYLPFQALIFSLKLLNSWHLLEKLAGRLEIVEGLLLTLKVGDDKGLLLIDLSKLLILKLEALYLTKLHHYSSYTKYEITYSIKYFAIWSFHHLDLETV